MQIPLIHMFVFEMYFFTASANAFRGEMSLCTDRGEAEHSTPPKLDTSSFNTSCSRNLYISCEKSESVRLI